MIYIVKVRNLNKGVYKVDYSCSLIGAIRICIAYMWHYRKKNGTEIIVMIDSLKEG